MQLWRRFFVVSLIVLFSRLAAASPVTEDARMSVESLHTWLGADSKGDAWRKYLKSDELLPQLVGESGPDRTLLANVLARFESGETGLDRVEFVRTRDSLVRLANQLQLTQNERLAADARMAGGRFLPIDEQRLSSAKGELTQAVIQLQNYLRVGDADNERKWKVFLKWDQLVEQLNAERPDPKVLNEISGQYFQGQLGLEEPKFVRVREAIVNYRWLSLAKESPEVHNAYNSQLELLSNSILTLDSDPSIVKETDISNRLDWLNGLGQATRLVSRMRQRHDFPNVNVVVTEPLLARAMVDSVDQVTPVSELILETQVRGTARTIGQISANIVPSDQHAAIDVYLNGVTTSDTIGNRPPVNIFSRGHTDVFGRTRILLDGASFRYDPATANCNTRTTIRSIRSQREGIGQRMIERIANRRAAEQKSLSERIASQRAERRIEHMMTARIQDRVAQANSRFDSKVRFPLLLRNAYPRWTRLYSTDDTIQIAAMQGRAHQFGAPTAPPQMPPHGFRVQLHESMAANTAINYMAGLTLTDESAAKVVKELTGKVPDSLQLREDEDPWSITFDHQNPVVLIFRNDELRFVIRGRKFTRGDQTLNRLIEISARYQMIPTNGRMKLVRQGDVEVVYPEREGQRLALSEITHRDFMRNKFGSLFEPEIVSEGIKIPDRLKNVSDLQLRYAKADRGWLSLGWE